MKPKALIVDDNSVNAYLLQTLLTAKDFEVATASNGQEALQSAEKNPPDIVISDILMPVMDGFSFCRGLKRSERLRSIPFIFYTATYTDPKDQEFALSLGADLFLVKPKDPEELVRLILEELEKCRLEGVNPASASSPEEVVYLQTYNRTLVRKLETKLLQLEEANKALAVKDFAIASAISGIVLSDLDGMLTYTNSSFAGMWGYASGGLAGMTAASLFADPGEAARLIAALHKEKRWIGEMKAVRKDGTSFVVQIAAHAVAGQDGNTVCLMASCIDISEQVRMREELQRAQKLESLSLFAAGIAHDFNNLLTGMFNGLELVKDCLPEKSPAQDQFEMTVSVFERARDLTKRLLAFAKGGSPIRRKLKVADVVRESCALSLSGSRIRHTVTVTENPWLVEADANQLSQVFNNIILNARQAMEDQGLLDISIANRSLSADVVGALPAGDYVVINFRDTGPGIPENAIPRIFDPFYTTKKEGSGLGLVTSYAIVKNHGGHIGVTSQVGAGASFEVWLPGLRKWEQERPPAPIPETTRGFGRILLMDDEVTIRKLAEHLLVKAGYVVSTAADGREAIEIYRRAMEEGSPFDLVVLDLTIRGGMGGEEALAKLKMFDPRVAAIASTGYSEESTLSRVKQHGFLGLLPKPYRSHELLSTVKAAVTRKAASSP
jgi:PAS domain S-box-containing protein